MESCLSLNPMRCENGLRISAFASAKIWLRQGADQLSPLYQKRRSMSAVNMQMYSCLWLRFVKDLGCLIPIFLQCLKRKQENLFVSYVTDYRMEQAARLLIETNEKSYVIAQKVGYTDPNYFSYVFKKEVWRITVKIQSGAYKK